MSGQSALQYSPTDEGFIVRVVGKGTLQQSPTVREFTLRCVKAEGLTVVLDLSRCGYLDSTFLGCLVGLNQNCCPDHNRRFLVFARSEDIGRLFGLTQIDKILHFVDRLPDVLDDFRDLKHPALDNDSLGVHIMEAHQRLARLGGPEATRFQSVADQLADDLRRRREQRDG